MSQTIYISHEIEGVLTNANLVQLASQDSTFGIKRGDTGEIIVPSGTSVSNPSIGTYEYSFSPVSGVVYLVSWEIISQENDEPKYVVQQIGPFEEIINNSISSTVNTSGLFVINTISTIQVKISNIDGSAVNPDTIIVSARNASDNTLIFSEVPEKIKDGYYVYEWIISSTIVPGKYNINWDYTVDGIAYTQLQEVVVSLNANSDSYIYNGRTLDMIRILEEYLCCAQYIPVYFEQSKPSKDNRIFQFSFPRWNQVRQTTIYRNKKILTENYEIDYFNGKVVFPVAQTRYDVINADYNFKMFSDDDLFIFLVNAVNFFNSFPPMSPIYQLQNLPNRWVPSVIYKAASDALRKMLLCLQFQEMQQVFGGDEKSNNIFNNVDTLKKEYDELWTKAFENKKFGPYPTPVVITVPEYTLPGGRSRWYRYLFGAGMSS